MKLNRTPLQIGAIAFLITALITSSLLTGQFYYENVMNRGFHFTTYILPLVYSALSIFPVVLTVSVLAMSFFSGIAFFKQRTPNMNFLKPLLFASICICLAAFFFNSFLVPKINLRVYLFSYYAKSTKSEADFGIANNDTNNRKYCELLDTYPQFCYLQQLIGNLNEQKQFKSNDKEKAIAYISKSANYNTIKSILDTSKNKLFGLKISDFPKISTIAADRKTPKEMESMIGVYVYESETYNEKISTYSDLLIRQIIYPVTLLLMVVNGLALSYVFRKVHFCLAIVSFYFLIPYVPIAFERWITHLIKNQMVTPLGGRSLYLLVFSLPVLFFIRIV